MRAYAFLDLQLILSTLRVFHLLFVRLSNQFLLINVELPDFRARGVREISLSRFATFAGDRFNFVANNFHQGELHFGFLTHVEFSFLKNVFDSIVVREILYLDKVFIVNQALQENVSVVILVAKNALKLDNQLLVHFVLLFFLIELFLWLEFGLWRLQCQLRVLFLFSLLL